VRVALAVLGVELATASVDVVLVLRMVLEGLGVADGVLDVLLVVILDVLLDVDRGGFFGVLHTPFLLPVAVRLRVEGALLVLAGVDFVGVLGVVNALLQVDQVAEVRVGLVAVPELGVGGGV